MKYLLQIQINMSSRQLNIQVWRFKRSLGYIFKFRNLQCITENETKKSSEANVDRRGWRLKPGTPQKSILSSISTTQLDVNVRILKAVDARSPLRRFIFFFFLSLRKTEKANNDSVIIHWNQENFCLEIVIKKIDSRGENNLVSSIKGIKASVLGIDFNLEWKTKIDTCMKIC